jgi:hypothetical protein
MGPWGGDGVASEGGQASTGAGTCSVLLRMALRATLTPEEHDPARRPSGLPTIERRFLKLDDSALDRSQLWSRLAAAAAPYLALDERVTRVMAKAAAAPDEDKAALYDQLPSAQELCRQRVVALSAARSALGRETFDRFLYEAVAPEVQIGTALTPAETLAMEEGCTELTPGAS